MPAASAFGPMETRARPTSRGRARCVSFRMGRQSEQTAAGSRAGACRLRRRALSDAALPRRGKGRCRCAGATLFAPAGQKRCRVGAPDFGLSRERAVCGAVCPSGMVGRRAGEEERSGLRSMKPLRFSRHPAGSTAGSARTRSRDQSLENPFLGNGHPQNAAGGRPLLVGRAGVYTEPKATGCRPRRPAPRRGRVGLGRGRSLGRE